MSIRFSANLMFAFFSASLFMACAKKDSAKPGTSSALVTPSVTPVAAYHTTGMGGMRKWNGSHYFRETGEHFPTPVHESYAYADTMMAVTVTDSETVQFMGQTYQYNMTYASWDARFFGNPYVNYSYNSGGGLIYFYLQDSIVYWQGMEHATSDQIELIERRMTHK